jgi:hypothetical protein
MFSGFRGRTRTMRTFEFILAGDANYDEFSTLVYLRVC